MLFSPKGLSLSNDGGNASLRKGENLSSGALASGAPGTGSVAARCRELHAVTKWPAMK